MPLPKKFSCAEFRALRATAVSDRFRLRREGNERSQAEFTLATHQRCAESHHPLRPSLSLSLSDAGSADQLPPVRLPVFSPPRESVRSTLVGLPLQRNISCWSNCNAERWFSVCVPMPWLHCEDANRADSGHVIDPAGGPNNDFWAPGGGGGWRCSASLRLAHGISVLSCVTRERQEFVCSLLMGKRFGLLLLLCIAAGRGSSASSPPGKPLLLRRRSNTALSPTALRSSDNGSKTQLAALRGGARGQTATKRTGMADGRLEGAARPSTSGLGRLRDAVFPIYGGEETGKFLALGGIQFFIIFVLTLTRDLKDTLIVTSCGAEAVSFLKVGPSVHHAHQRLHIRTRPAAAVAAPKTHGRVVRQEGDHVRVRKGRKGRTGGVVQPTY